MPNKSISVDEQEPVHFSGSHLTQERSSLTLHGLQGLRLTRGLLLPVAESSVLLVEHLILLYQLSDGRLVLQVNLHDLVEDRHLCLVHESITACLEGAAHRLRVWCLIAVEQDRDLSGLGHRLQPAADVDRGNTCIDGCGHEHEI